MGNRAGGQTPESILVSVVITTYNRNDALAATLAALGKQTVPAQRYEVLVVDNGSSDATPEVLACTTLPCALATFRLPQNRGISGGRNVAIRAARGRYLVFLSDDLIVPEDFLATHVQTLERFPGWWVVGGMRQLDALAESPFGRYLDGLERDFEAARKARPMGPDLWEMGYPTARNLSLPSADLDRIGLFDEQFRDSCEDQDLAQRAKAIGIRFLYHAGITSLHNDQVGDLKRFCRAQIPRTHDTVLFCHKWPAEHGRAPVARLNGYVARGDGALLVLRKLIKSALATAPLTGVVEGAIALLERVQAADPILWRMYRLVIGLYMFRGWRRGLETLELRGASRDAHRIGYHPGV